jgi:hypothetical protein
MAFHQKIKVIKSDFPQTERLKGEAILTMIEILQ